MGGRGRVKRQQIDTEDGWTVITHGLSNLSVDNGKKKGKGSRNNAQAGFMPTAIVQGLTAEKLLQDFQNRTRKWETTACAKHLVDVLAKAEKNVTDAVCIGIGSFSRDWEHRHRAMWQLVLFMGVISYLRQSSTEVKLYAQEPAFTSLDHDFLSLLSVNVCVNDITTRITPQSFVFSPFVDWYLLLPIFLRDKDPVLYVGNEILNDYGAYAQSEEKREKLDECNRLGQNWLAKRDVVKLRGFEMHPHALNGMVVYWNNAEAIGDAGTVAGKDSKSGHEARQDKDKADRARQEGDKREERDT
ncbi:hypothetical protein N0V91_000967 [Didymella pomorum]|uniref:SRR1-like domain-containing protein n=1 Tax=Didymella pomorum TaxID=749634 RepID=A0A9W8ZNL8_9PLEO|nr:hypothetical protein N0V91_000967 [Didymella pomorum]